MPPIVVKTGSAFISNGFGRKPSSYPLCGPKPNDLDEDGVLSAVDIQISFARINQLIGFVQHKNAIGPVSARARMRCISQIWIRVGTGSRSVQTCRTSSASPLSY